MQSRGDRLNIAPYTLLLHMPETAHATEKAPTM